MSISPSLPVTLFFVYALFLSGCFITLLWTPYLIIRYINLKLFNNCDNAKFKYLSKVKTWLLTVLCLPLTAFLVIFFCEYFGDSSFLGFFMLLGVLASSPILAYFLLPKVKKLEAQLEQNASDE